MTWVHISYWLSFHMNWKIDLWLINRESTIVNMSQKDVDGNTTDIITAYDCGDIITS